MLKIFAFIDIWFVKQDIQKWLKTKICSFLWRIWKWKEKGAKKFPPKIWNLREIRFIKPGVLRTSGLYLVCITLLVLWFFEVSRKGNISPSTLTLCVQKSLLPEWCPPFEDDLLCLHHCCFLKYPHFKSFKF